MRGESEMAHMVCIQTLRIIMALQYAYYTLILTPAHSTTAQGVRWEVLRSRTLTPAPTQTYTQHYINYPIYIYVVDRWE